MCVSVISFLIFEGSEGFVVSFFQSNVISLVKISWLCKSLRFHVRLCFPFRVHNRFWEKISLKKDVGARLSCQSWDADDFPTNLWGCLLKNTNLCVFLSWCKTRREWEGCSTWGFIISRETVRLGSVTVLSLGNETRREEMMTNQDYTDEGRLTEGDELRSTQTTLSKILVKEGIPNQKQETREDDSGCSWLPVSWLSHMHEKESEARVSSQMSWLHQSCE